MIIYKATVTIIVTLLVIYIAEKSPKMGGLILGLPIGTGIVMVFYAIEQDSSFVLSSIPYGILGLTCALFFSIGFYLGGKIAPFKPLTNTISAFCIGLILFLSIGYTLHQFEFDIYGSVILLLLTVSFSVIFYSNISNEGGSNKERLTLPSLIFRVVFVTGLVLAITGGAGIVGAKWSGIMASFPTGLSSVCIVLSYSYGNRKYPIVLKYFSYSVTTLLVFYLSLMYMLPSTGIAFSFVSAYAVSAIYLILLNRLVKKR